MTGRTVRFSAWLGRRIEKRMDIAELLMRVVERAQYRLDEAVDRHDGDS
jgi:hypothetical protein